MLFRNSLKKVFDETCQEHRDLNFEIENLEVEVKGPLLTAIREAISYEDLCRKLAGDLIEMGTIHFRFELDKKPSIEFMAGTNPADRRIVYVESAFDQALNHEIPTLLELMDQLRLANEHVEIAINTLNVPQPIRSQLLEVVLSEEDKVQKRAPKPLPAQTGKKSKSSIHEDRV